MHFWYHNDNNNAEKKHTKNKSPYFHHYCFLVFVASLFRAQLGWLIEICLHAGIWTCHSMFSSIKITTAVSMDLINKERNLHLFWFYLFGGF